MTKDITPTAPVNGVSNNSTATPYRKITDNSMTPSTIEAPVNGASTPGDGTTNDGTITQHVQEASDLCQHVVDINLATAGLEAIEAVVERGIDTFITVGEALLAIRDRHLYGQGTFEDYLQERWGMSRQRGYQFMDAATVVRTMTANGLPPPKSESAARALATIKNDPKALAEVSKELEGQSVTGETTKAAVKRVTQKKMPPTSPDEQAPEAPKESKEDKRIDWMFGTASKLCSELGSHFPETMKGEFVERYLRDRHLFERESVEKAIDFFTTLRNIGDKLHWFQSSDDDTPVASSEPAAKPKRKRKGTSRAVQLDDAMELLNGPDVEKAKDAAAAYLDGLDGKAEWQGDPPAFEYSDETVQEVLGVVEAVHEQTENQVSGMEGTPFENTSKYEDLQGSLEALEALREALENLEGVEVPETPSDPKDRDAWKSYAEALSKLHDGIEDALSAADDVCFP